MFATHNTPRIPRLSPRTPPDTQHGQECPDYLEMTTIDIKDVVFNTGDTALECSVSVSVLTDKELVPFSSLERGVRDLALSPGIDPQAVGTVVIDVVKLLMSCRAISCTVKIPLSKSVELTTIHGWECRPPDVQENKECPLD